MNPFEIEDYQFGRMVINGKTYNRDLILLPDRIQDNWWRKEGHCLNIEDIQAVLDAKPDVLVVGTGSYGIMKIPENIRQAVERAGIQMHSAKTGEAWQLYNNIRTKQPCAGAFHLTC